MERTDLKSGMVVKLRDWKDKFILIDDVFCSYERKNFLKIGNYDEKLNFKNDNKLDIVEVYKCKYPNLLKCLIEDKLELIWKREKEIDWSKVPLGTKVRVWDYDKQNNFEGKFIFYDKKEEEYCPFIVFVKNVEHLHWRDCELIEEPKEEKEVTYEEILKASEEYCDKNISTVGCRNCKHSKKSFCEYSWILENYNVTRK